MGDKGKINVYERFLNIKLPDAHKGKHKHVWKKMSGVQRLCNGEYKQVYKCTCGAVKSVKG